MIAVHQTTQAAWCAGVRDIPVPAEAVKLRVEQAHIAVGGREHISLMSVKLTRINRATGRRKESCEDPRRAPIAQEQHTSSNRFLSRMYLKCISYVSRMYLDYL